MSEVDKLTGFLSQKYFLQRLEEEIPRTQRYKRSLSLLKAKVNFDYFDKSLNSATNVFYPVFRQLSVIFRNLLRSTDLPARYQGDCILVMLPETDEQGAGILAQRLCKEIEGHEFNDGSGALFRVAVSIGIAVYPKHGQHAKELVFSVDKGLQAALTKGGNGFEYCPVSVEEIR